MKPIAVPSTSLNPNSRIGIECLSDPISQWRAFVRSLRPLRVIAHRSLRGPYTQTEFLEAIRKTQLAAAKSTNLREKSVGLWKMEKIGFSYCRHGKNSLNDQTIPITAQPILHVGLGIAATEAAQFNAERIIGLIEPRAHPDFRLFPYESIGCIWAVYANRWFQKIFRFVSKAKIPPCKLPKWGEFIAHFSPEIQRLVSHGYGRTVYFKEFDVRRAIRSVVRLESLDTPAAVQGIAFAYAMLNHRDLFQILEVGTDIRDRSIAKAFENGLIYALAFWDWAYLGFLDDLSPKSERQRELITHAMRLVRESRKRNSLAVFGIH